MHASHNGHQLTPNAITHIRRPSLAPRPQLRPQTVRSAQRPLRLDAGGRHRHAIAARHPRERHPLPARTPHAYSCHHPAALLRRTGSPVETLPGDGSRSRTACAALLTCTRTPAFFLSQARVVRAEPVDAGDAEFEDVDWTQDLPGPVRCGSGGA